MEYKPYKIDEEEIRSDLESGKVFLHGTDKNGHPCLIIKVALHIPEETTYEKLMKYGMYWMFKAFKIADEYVVFK